MSISPSQLFVRASVDHLLEEYMARIARAIEVLPADDLWWRPHESSTSIANLLIHLEGNVRQWILSGLAGHADARNRAGEFSARDSASAGTLLATLRETVSEACAVLEELDDASLASQVTIQGFETTGLEAAYHVVEHFSWHTGQITWIAKLRAGADHRLAFYDDDSINRARNE